MQKREARPGRILRRLGQVNRPSSALFLISAIAGLWLASIVLGTVHGAGGLPTSNVSPSTGGVSLAPQKSAPSTPPVWEDINPSTLRNKIAPGVPDNARTLRLNADALAEVFKAAPMEFTSAAALSQAVLALPMPDGKFEQFRLVESPIMQPELLKKFPEIKSYAGQAIDHPRMTMRCDYSPRGFNTLVLMDGNAVSVHPARWDDVTTYVSYYGQDFQVDNSKPLCGVDAAEELKAEKWTKTSSSQPAPLATGATLRQYRLAIAVTQEYYNEPSLGGGSLANAVASLNTWLNAVDAIYERSQTVTWSVNNTNAAPINCANVKITLSTDGGNTFPIVLAASTANDGSESINVPNGVQTPSARIKVESIGNIFFDIDDANFTINTGDTCPIETSISPLAGNAGTSVTITGINFTGVSAVKFSINVSASFTVNSDTQITATVPSGAVTGPITLSKSGCSDAQTASFAVCTSAPILMSVDDGTITNINGASYLVNRLTPSSYPATLTRVSIYFGNDSQTPNAGTPLTVLAGANTDGDSTINNTSFQQLSSTVMSRGGFNFYEITPITISAGDFVVGFYMASGLSNYQVYSENHSPQGRSYYSGNGVNFSADGFDYLIRGYYSTGCGVQTTIFPTSQDFLASGGSGAIAVTAGGSWTAASNDSWIHITTGSSGSGNGTVTYSVDVNNSGLARTGTMTISGQTFTVTQGVCSASISPGSRSHSGGVNGGTVAITSPAGCTWTAASNNDWIAVTSACSATPSSLAVDDGGLEFVAGGSYFVNRLTPASYPATLTEVQIYIHGDSRTQGGLPYALPIGTAITILVGTNTDGNTDINNSISRSFSGTVQAQYAFNTYAITPVTINSGDFVIGYKVPSGVAVFPHSKDDTAPDNGRSYSSSDGTTFNLESTVDYLLRGSYFSGCSASSGTGDGTVVYSVAANNTGSSRSGTMTIGGQTFTITQDACAFSISPASQSFAGAGTGSVNVTSLTGCTWPATSNDSWIVITSGSSGTGNGTVNYSVAANNTGSQRSGTVTIAGQTFTVTEAACAFSISPASRTHDGGTVGGTVAVTTSSGCNWTASSNASFITVTSACQTSPTVLSIDDGGINFTTNVNYAVNRLTPASYPATLTQVQVYNYGASDGPPLGTALVILAGANTDGDNIINGSITQQVNGTVQTRGEYNVYNIAPITITSGNFVVGFGLDPAWTSRRVAWDNSSASAGRCYTSSDGTNFTLDTNANENLMIRASYFSGCSASSATGSGTVIYSVAANNTASSRSGTMTIGGQTFTVNQAACSGSISPTSRTHNAGASKTTAVYSVTVTAPSSGARTLLAFAADQRKSPAQIAANQPSNYRDPGQHADYLIITRKDLIASFGPLANLRNSQGLTSMVIDVEDLYDEFGFGNKSPQAIRDFLTYAKTSWAGAPRFVVLAGDATYDPKNYLALGDFDVVPTRFVETAFNEASTDDWFTDVNNDGVPDIAIGRLPVRTPAEAAAMVTKLVNYDSSAASNNVLLVADRNSNYDFEAADAQLRALVPASFTVTDIRRGQWGDADARTQLLAAMNSGAKVVNYYGHGSTTVWTDAPILSASDAASLTNTGHLSLVVSMTCLNGYFYTPTIESLGESLLKAQGGAIAVWASSGLTDPTAQTVMSRDAISRLLSGSNRTIGEVVALAKAAITNQDVRRTWILLGDPATKLR